MIIVSGAAGQLGRLTVEALLEKVTAGRIRALTRDPGKIAELANRGVEVKPADFGDPSTLAPAFAGGEVLLLISTDDLNPGVRIRQHAAAIDAAKAAGVRHIVYTSATDPRPENPATAVVDHRETETLLASSGLAWTSLRNNLYFDLLLNPGALPGGAVVGNTGEGRTARVARADCAAVAAAVLANPDPYAGRALEITGPESLTAADLAALLTEVAGRPVALHDLPDEAYAGALAGAGLPSPLVQALATFGQAIREGWFADVSPVVAEVTGRPATTARAFFQANRPALLAALGG